MRAQWTHPGIRVALAGVLMFCGRAAQAGQDAPPAAAIRQVQQPSVSGRVVDATGVAVAGATVQLSRNDGSANQQTISSSDGAFTFDHVAPGPFQLTISAAEFTTEQYSGTLAADQNLAVPAITLRVATLVTEVRVVPPQVIAEAQIKEEEKQKALGIIPNYYVSYVPNAVALTPKQKYELAWKTMIDPMTFGITGAVAGIQQAQNDFSGYGQGAQGYAKRFGASYAEDAIGTFLGSAVLPSLFKQDPRYFYKGSGSKRSRILYAVANSVICKGDNGHWQANYSAILGSLASGGISNLYYPASDRNGARLTFENTLIGIGANAAANVLQEFVIRKLTPSLQGRDPGGSGGSAKTHSLVSRAFGSPTREGN